MKNIRDTVISTAFFSRIYYRLLFDYLTIALVLLGAMLLAIGTRCGLGTEVPQECDAKSSVLCLIVILVSVLAAMCSISLRRIFHIQVSRRIRFFSLLVGLCLTIAVVLFMLPDTSRLEVGYYALAALFIGMVTILWSPYLYEYGKRITIIEHLKRLWKNRFLIRLWVGFNVKSRYSQSVLGILWIIFLPLSTSLIITFVFSKLMRPFDIGGAPYIVFFLSALTFWTVFNQGVLNGSTSLVNSMGLMTQVNFPREVLVIVKVGESFVDLLFIFASMIVINAIFGIFPNANYIYLPFVIGIQLLLTIGLGLILSYLTVIARDIPNLIGVLLQLAFYVTPIIYPASVVPQRFRFVLLINPLTPLLNAYRSIIAFNQAPDLVSLYIPTVVACVLLYIAYKIFKSRERTMADFL